MARTIFSVRYLLLAAAFICLAALAISVQADVPAAAPTVSPATDPTADIDRSIDLPVTQIGQPLPRADCLVLNITTRSSGDGAIVAMNIPGKGRQEITFPPDGKAPADELQAIINHSPRTADHGARILLVVGTNVRFSALAPVLIDCVMGRAHEFNFITRSPDGKSLQMLSDPIPVGANNGRENNAPFWQDGRSLQMLADPIPVGANNGPMSEIPRMEVQLESVAIGHDFGFKARVGDSQFTDRGGLLTAMQQKCDKFASHGIKPDSVQVTIFPNSATRYEQLIAVNEIILKAGFSRVGFGIQP